VVTGAWVSYSAQKLSVLGVAGLHADLVCMVEYGLVLSLVSCWSRRLVMIQNVYII